jgi:guanylate kinase
MTRKKQKPEEIEIRFRNSPSEILESEKFDKLCLDISSFEKSLRLKLKAIEKKHGARVSIETYYRLEEG